MTITYLHIGKTAGTQIAFLAQEINRLSPIKIEIAPHKTKLKDISSESDYFFSIRNPISRFVSAFYTRKNKGGERYLKDWSPDETMAYSYFPEANDLAESLFVKGEQGRLALAAMQSVGHIAMHQIDWFVSAGFHLTLRPPIWIIRQEYFEPDFNDFISRSKIPVSMDMLRGFINNENSNKTDYKSEVFLSSAAIHNLNIWYSRDMAFYNSCESWLLSRLK